jgi:steroid 5-alpha reductase family enzyme
MKKSRAVGFAIIAVIYVVACAIGVALFLMLQDLHVFWRILIADVGATVFVFFAGVVLKNASVYDPYWSVAPPVIITGVTVYFGRIDPGVFLLLLAVWFWGVRLTCNWAYTFVNLGKQDWRYDHFKEKFPRIFQLVSFCGINMFPTIVVYVCLLPGIAFIQESALNAVTVAGFLVCIASAVLQLFADLQMHRFRRENKDGSRIIRTGLWKHSRHPNYLGEITMWWGVYIIVLSAAPELWWLGFGPLVNTIMFLVVSIPLADKRNRKIRADFDDYVKSTRSLLPFRKIG